MCPGPGLRDEGLTVRGYLEFIFSYNSLFKVEA